MAVDYDIFPQALVDFAHTTLLPPLTEFAKGFGWDFSKMVVRETTSWQDVMKVDLVVPYFQGRFMKPKPGAKSGDGALMFAPPKNPVEFTLIIDHEQWLQSEEFIDDAMTHQLANASRPVSAFHVDICFN